MEPSSDGAAASPYGSKWTRWVRPVVLALLLVAFDEQGVVAFLAGCFLALVYLPRSLFSKKFAACRRERLSRLGIYAAAVIAVFGLRVVTCRVARERADRIVAAVDAYKAARGSYPDRLDQLVPEFIPEIPAKARLTPMDRGFSYLSGPSGHVLWYVETPPFGRPTYTFERGKWGTID